MKLRLTSLSLPALCLMLAAVSAMAQTVYSNGPPNGNTNAWTINFGYAVSDTFNVANNGTTITGTDFVTWGILNSVELSITSGENGGTSYFDQMLNVIPGTCTRNQYDYAVCQESVTFSGPTLNSGTYWLNLQDAQPPSSPVYWDENSGPSSASENYLGTIPSESFTILGGNSTTSTGGTVPEPGSIALFGSGFFGLLGVLRRKLF
jgi:hypothetical protein